MAWELSDFRVTYQITTAEGYRVQCPDRLLLLGWWLECRVPVPGLFRCENPVQGLVQDLDSIRLHFCDYSNGCVDLLQIKAQQDYFIVQWAESSEREEKVYQSYRITPGHTYKNYLTAAVHGLRNENYLTVANIVPTGNGQELTDVTYLMQH